MRTLLIIGTLVLVACEKPKEATAEPDREELPSAERAMMSLRELDVSEHHLALKLHVYPVFRTHVFVEVFFPKPEDGLYATARAYRLTGRAGYETGETELVFERQLDGLESSDGYSRFERTKFWDLPATDDVDGLDGTTWTIEAKQGDRFHEVSRWEPESEVHINQERLQFAELGRWVFGTTGIHPYHPAEQQEPQQDEEPDAGNGDQ